MLVGRILTDGRLNAKVKCDLTNNLTLKVNAQVHYYLLEQKDANIFASLHGSHNLYLLVCIIKLGRR